MVMLDRPSGEKRSADDIKETEIVVSKLPKVGNYTLAETLLKSTETTTSSFGSADNQCYVTSAFSKQPDVSSVENELELAFDPFDSIQEWLNKELGGKTDPEPEFRSDSPIFDDWDDITYDSDDDDDDEFDFLRPLSPPNKSLDRESIPGSEGYGTDTSDVNDSLRSLFNCSSDLLISSKSSLLTAQPISESDIAVKGSKAPDTTKQITFTSSQTVCAGKPQVEAGKPRILSLKDNRIKGTLPKEAKITKVYQIPAINNGSAVLSKVGTQTRKTVVVKVLKPKNGIIRVKKTDTNMTGMRTAMKMQLQRDQIINEEKLKQKITVVNSQAKSSATSALNLPSYVVTKPALPAGILKVETGLQNPTRYHVRETQRNQVKDYLSQSHDGSKYVIRQILAPQSSAPTGGGGDAFHSGTPASPLARLKISTSADNYGDNDVSEIIDDIVSLESSLGEEHRLDRVATTFSTVSPTDLNRFAQNAGNQLPIIIRENVSSSCPVIKQELTDEDIRLFNKDRIKKDNHNIIERRRRYNINDRIKELGQMVPKSLEPDMKWNKGSILKAAVDYIRTLQSERTHFRKVEQRNKEMENMNKKLLVRVGELEAALQQHGVNPAADEAEKQRMVNVLISSPSNTTTSSLFTNEEERVLSIPSNTLASPLPSHVVLVTQPQTSAQQEMMTVQSESNQPSFQLSPQLVYQDQQLLAVDVNALSPQQQQHLSPNHSFNQFNYSPHGSTESNVTSPNSVSMQQQPTESNVELKFDGMPVPGMDISTFDFDNPASADLSNIDGGFGALLASGDNNTFSDVIMDDDFSMIKTDLFLSDANNPSQTNSNIQQ